MPKATFLAFFIRIRFARPATVSDSWIIYGILKHLAASPTGRQTKPPLRKMTLGLDALRNSRQKETTSPDKNPKKPRMLPQIRSLRVISRWIK